MRDDTGDLRDDTGNLQDAVFSLAYLRSSEGGGAGLVNSGAGHVGRLPCRQPPMKDE